jgi:hypothetical protein
MARQQFLFTRGRVGVWDPYSPGIFWRGKVVIRSVAELHLDFYFWPTLLLLLTDVTFANLPPHFLLNDEDYLSSGEWEDILPGYSTFYPLNFREVIPFLLASFIHHQPYLALVEIAVNYRFKMSHSCSNYERDYNFQSGSLFLAIAVSITAKSFYW